nr:hypothetical protein BaRGS_024967 [Batillaria attramentaria]
MEYSSGIKRPNSGLRLGDEVWLTMPDFLMAKGVLGTTNFTAIADAPSEEGEQEEEKEDCEKKDEAATEEEDQLDRSKEKERTDT